MHKSSVSTFGFILFSIILPVVAGAITGLTMFLKDRSLPAKKVVSSAIEAALVGVAAVALVVGIAYLIFFIPTIYDLHQNQGRVISELERKDAVLENELKERKQNVPRADPAFEHMLGSVGLFLDLRRSLNGEPCAIYFTTPPASDYVYDMLYSTASQSGCSVTGANAMGNPDLDNEIIDGMVNGAIVLHRAQGDAAASKLADSLASLVRTRQSYTLPKPGHYMAPFPPAKDPRLPTHVIWLQFGSDVRWNSEL